MWVMNFSSSSCYGVLEIYPGCVSMRGLAPMVPKTCKSRIDVGFLNVFKVKRLLCLKEFIAIVMLPIYIVF